MRNLKASLLKRIYGAKANPAAARRQFEKPFWSEAKGERHIACRSCPKFDTGRERCTVPFGTPIRKCIVASIEAHMYDCTGKDVLEIGFGTFTLPKNLALRSGGTWTGIEPRRTEKAEFGKGGYGHAGDIPFEDATFDFIYGIQSLEHWREDHAPLAPFRPWGRVAKQWDV